MLNVIKNALDEKISQSTTEATSNCELEFEEAIDILSATRRRYVIDYLNTIDGEVSLRELSEYIANLENSDRKNIYIALYQQHLDKMSDADVIIYDEREGVVAPGPHCGVLYQIVEQIEQKLD